MTDKSELLAIAKTARDYAEGPTHTRCYICLETAERLEALAAQPRDDVREAAAKYGKPNKHGHVTRYSDSSLYDEKCVLCGMVDGSIMSPREQTIYNTDCPKNPPALRTDRKAVLEEAAKTAAEERLQEPQDESDEAYNRGVRDAIAAIRALAEGAGK